MNTAQISDSSNTGIGVKVTSLTAKDSKAPALSGGVEQSGVPTGKQGK